MVWHAWVVPTADDVLFDELAQLTFGGNDVSQIQTREFVLLRYWLFEESTFSGTGDDPVVRTDGDLGIQSTDRVRDVFNRVFEWVGVIVHRVMHHLSPVLW